MKGPLPQKQRQYLEKYKQRREGIIKENLSKLQDPGTCLLEKCQEFFEPLIASSQFFREKINGRVLLDVSGKVNEKIILDFTKEKNPVKIFEGEDYFYTLKIKSKILNLILTKKLSWEQLLLSLRFNASRNPDIFNEFLVVFLRFAYPPSYKQFELYEKRKNLSDMFILNHNGEKFQVQKYCPHAMGDLSKGQIKDDYIICPNHGWQFSLKDGSCLNNQASIKIRKLH